VACEATSYSDDEYARVLASHHDPLAKWTKEETDVLMKLCARFDLRWVVVADRYNTHPLAKGALRSVEDVKYRYYEVTRLLSEFRDKEKAKAAESAVAASNGGVKQEEGAVEVKSEAEATVKAEPGVTPPAATAAVPAAAPSSSAAATPSSSPSSEHYYRFNIAYEKQRKRQLELAFTRTIEEENEIRKLNEELRSVEQQLKKAAVKVDPKKKKELADVPFEIKRSMPTGVFLRSTTLALPPAQPKHHALSSKLVKKMQTLLDELGVPARPMPTKPVCDMFDHLRQDTVGLLTLRKHLAAKQAEAQLLKDRYQSLTGKVFEPVTSKLQRSVRRGDSGAVAGAGANTSAGHSATPATKGACSFLPHADSHVLTTSCSLSRQVAQVLGEGAADVQQAALNRQQRVARQAQQEDAALGSASLSTRGHATKPAPGSLLIRVSVAPINRICSRPPPVCGQHTRQR